ncbi:MAG TPA: hypothetical protein VF395_08975 [Polyangiaceae bacterium]
MLGEYESEHDRSRLFDLRTDPGEVTNVAEREPARTKLYRDHILTWLGAP